MDIKIWYLCDGEKPDCKKNFCYRKGGVCRHTRDIQHAINFKQNHCGNFIEIIQDKIPKLCTTKEELKKYSDDDRYICLIDIDRKLKT